MIKDKDRVGARPGSTHPPAGGGGYQDICRNPVAAVGGSAKIFRENLKLTIDDLKKIGITGKWLEVAERVGIDTWLEIWTILDRENVSQPLSMRDSIRVRIPMYSNFIRFVRNRYIHQMTDAGKSAQEIYRFIKYADLEPVSISCIRSIQSEYKNRSKNG